MKYLLSKKYSDLKYINKIMGPNPIKLAEELLYNSQIPQYSRVIDLGSGNGVTSVFICKEFKYNIYAADLWSDPKENQKFFNSLNIPKDALIPVKADAENLPFDKNYFDALICIDSYNFFGRDKDFLDNKILPFIKPKGYLYIAISGVKENFNGNYPKEILLSWNKEQMEYMKTIDYWKEIFSASKNSKIIEIKEMEGNEELWQDWIKTNNSYAKSDSVAINAGASKYLNFIKIVLQKN